MIIATFMPQGRNIPQWSTNKFFGLEDSRIDLLGFDLNIKDYGAKTIMAGFIKNFQSSLMETQFPNFILLYFTIKKKQNLFRAHFPPPIIDQLQ